MSPRDSQDRSAALYRTPLGTAYVGDSRDGMRRFLKDDSVALVITSPPFALVDSKEYGNEAEQDYIEWFLEFASIIWAKLKEDGSLVLDLGGAWKKGKPVRSLYQFKLLIELCEQMGDESYFLAQEFYWYNPSKMPLPAQWVNVERSRVKDSVNVVWWLSKSERPKANNRNVLRPYSEAMKKLLERGTYNGGRRPGGAVVNAESWKKRQAGAIPPNVLPLPFDDPGELDVDNFIVVGNSESASRYHRAYKELLEAYKAQNREAELREFARKHPARFPRQLPKFFIDFLTEPGDMIVDPFAGSNVTGHVAEEAGRKWKSFEMHRYYLEPSIARFDDYFTGGLQWLDPEPPALEGLGAAETSRILRRSAG